MNKFRGFFRRLFCRHESATFLRNIYGDEINSWSTTKLYRSLWRCDGCGAICCAESFTRTNSTPMKGDE